MNKGIDFAKNAYGFVTSLAAKQYKQVMVKSLSLMTDPTPNDSRPLKGYPYLRTDIGEFRIVYRFDDTMVYIVAIGKRNDDEVYKGL